MKISERIFSIMKDKKVSQLELSQATGISQSVISDWKTKKTNPLSNKILAICEALDCEPYDILYDEHRKRCD